MSFETVDDLIDNYDAFIILDPGQTRLFSLTNCEICNFEVAGNSGITIDMNPVFMHPLNLILEQKLRQYEDPPDELSWCDKLGCAVCSACWKEDDQT